MWDRVCRKGLPCELIVGQTEREHTIAELHGEVVNPGRCVGSATIIEIVERELVVFVCADGHILLRVGQFKFREVLSITADRIPKCLS